MNPVAPCPVCPPCGGCASCPLCWWCVLAFALGFLACYLWKNRPKVSFTGMIAKVVKAIKDEVALIEGKATPPAVSPSSPPPAPPTPPTP